MKDIISPKFDLSSKDPMNHGHFSLLIKHHYIDLLRWNQFVSAVCRRLELKGYFTMWTKVSDIEPHDHI